MKLSLTEVSLLRWYQPVDFEPVGPEPVGSETLSRDTVEIK